MTSFAVSWDPIAPNPERPPERPMPPAEPWGLWLRCKLYRFHENYYVQKMTTSCLTLIFFNPGTTGLGIYGSNYLKITRSDRNSTSWLFEEKSWEHTLDLKLGKKIGKLFRYHDFYQNSRFFEKLVWNFMSISDTESSRCDLSYYI